MARHDDVDEGRQRRRHWPAITESDLWWGYRNVKRLPPSQTAQDERRRRPGSLRPGDRGGPLSQPPVRPWAGNPVRLVIYLPVPGADRPWVAWLVARGWRTHRVGAAMYAHDPRRPDLPGWLVGFLEPGQLATSTPPWLRWMAANRTRHPFPHRDRSRYEVPVR